MGKLLVLIPMTGLSGEDLVQRKEFISSVVRPATEFVIEVAAAGVESIESRYDEVLCIPPMLPAVREAESKGFDAVLLWCLADPGLTVARELVNIPVIGPGESSVYLASMMAHRFSIITPLDDETEVWGEEMAARAGFLHKLASIRSLGLPVLTLRSDLELTVRRIVEMCEAAVNEDKAHAIILGCMGLYGLAKSLETKLNVPVIDPAVAGIRMAELFMDTGYFFSKKTYPLPYKMRQG